jgi:hypothetical protein
MVFCLAQVLPSLLNQRDLFFLSKFYQAKIPFVQKIVIIPGPMRRKSLNKPERDAAARTPGFEYSVTTNRKL